MLAPMNGEVREGRLRIPWQAIRSRRADPRPRFVASLYFIAADWAEAEALFDRVIESMGEGALGILDSARGGD